MDEQKRLEWAIQNVDLLKEYGTPVYYGHNGYGGTQTKHAMEEVILWELESQNNNPPKGYYFGSFWYAGLNWRSNSKEVRDDFMTRIILLRGVESVECGRWSRPVVETVETDWDDVDDGGGYYPAELF